MAGNVAVLVPTRPGRAMLLADALASVRRQSCPDWEIFLRFDGDDIAGRVLAIEAQAIFPPERLHIFPAEGPGRGEAWARNRLLEAFRDSGCDLACWLDDDDIMHAERITKQADYMRAHDDVALSFCDIGVFHPTASAILAVHGSRPITPRRTVDPSRYDNDLRSFRNNLNTPSAMFRPSVVDVRFAESVRTGGTDLVWIYELVQRGFRIGYLPEQLYYLRQHQGRLTRVRDGLAPEVVQEDLVAFRAEVERIRRETVGAGLI